MLELESNKEISFTTHANLYRGTEVGGGRMNITNEEVIFDAHKINMQGESLVIKMEDIDEVKKRRTLFIVPNGLKIKLNSGEEYKFVVSKRSALITHITSQLRRINEGNSTNTQNSESGRI